MTLTEIACHTDSLEKANKGIDVARLCFDNNYHIFLGVNIDTDEICYCQPLTCNFVFTDIGEFGINLRKLYGMHISNVWELINNNGYFDAVLLAFKDNSKNSILCEFLVSGSTLNLYESTKINGYTRK